VTRLIALGNLIESRMQIGVVSAFAGQGVTSTPWRSAAVAAQRSEDAIALDAVDRLGSLCVRR
jgi:hypothetical protein